MNWVIAAFGGIGHLYSTRSKDLYNLNYAADFVAKKGISVQGLSSFLSVFLLSRSSDVL